MIYLMYGSAAEKARVKVRALTDALQAKKPDALFYRITSLTYEEQPLASLVSGQGLFESKYIVLFDNVFESKEIKEEIVSSLEEIASSDNVFIFLEGSLDAKTLAKMEKHAAKVQVFDAAEGKKRQEFNAFALSDAILSKDKKKAWMMILDIKKRGGAPEETHGMLWWQVKSLSLVQEAKDAKEADLSPYVFSKAKAATKIFSPEENSKMLFDLAKMYHDAHRGECDLWIEMEKWVLKL